MTLTLDPKITALVAIDLQGGTTSRELAPHSASDVVQRSARIADALRAKGGTVVFVHVLIGEILSRPADVSWPQGTSAPPPEASELVPEIGLQPTDIVVTKRQWGAFYGTDLDQQLRRRGVKTIVLTGIATNFGVESTARWAYDVGYELVFAEDATSSLSAEAHKFPVENVFPRMGRVRSTDEVIRSWE